MAPSRLHDHTGRQPGARAPGLSHSLVQLGADTLAVWGPPATARGPRLRGRQTTGTAVPRGPTSFATISRPTCTSVWGQTALGLWAVGVRMHATSAAGGGQHLVVAVTRDLAPALDI